MTLAIASHGLFIFANLTKMFGMNYRVSQWDPDNKIVWVAVSWLYSEYLLFGTKYWIILLSKQDKINKSSCLHEDMTLMWYINL